MIDDFIAVLDVGAGLGLVSYDESAVRAPHRDVTDFEPAALNADAARLTTIAHRLAGLAGSGDDVAGLWSGRAGDAASTVFAATSVRRGSICADVAASAAALRYAASALDEVMSRYSQAMAAVCAYRVLGIDLDALPAAVATRAISRDEARGEFIARIEYADGAGRAAHAAVRDVVSALNQLTGAGDSPGELILAGDR
ncbi:hypothetical protein [Gordonia zhaorongruii]|uniref:hypothetical protein n=1 Tax=Gordonia zhaorongruii TaxID=2597659 RepID=UPI00104A7134|nr:hypothetical protein [Gordonia zhaorongruii]